MLLFAPMLLAATLHLGAPLPVADLQPGDPATWDRVMAAWTDAQGVNVAVGRLTPEHFEVVRMTIRKDGSADPNALDVYPIPVRQSGVGRIGDDLMAAWLSNDGTVLAQRITRDGRPLTATVPVPFGLSPQRVLCSDTTCFVDAHSGGVFIDGNGNSIGRPPGRIDDIVASPAGFLTFDIVARAVTVRDRRGAALTTIDIPDDVAQLSWDGTRYLVATETYQDFNLSITGIDPISGSASTRTINLGMFFDHVRLGWNGTQYLLNFNTMMGYVVMRLDASLRPIDTAPIPIAMGYQYDWPVIVGTQDGFRILFDDTNAMTTMLLRTAFVRNDGTVIPGAQPVIKDRASQKSLAAAESRSAILGVWGEGHNVFAARMRRDGSPLDAAPIAVGTASTPVRAASDGDGFLIAWDKRALLIDGDGRTAAIDLPVADRLQYASLEFTNGAYQLAVFGNCRVTGVTILPTGAVTQVVPVPIDCPDSSNNAVAFDGRHIVALWLRANHLRSIAKDTVSGTVTGDDLLEYTGPYLPTMAFARDRETLLMFYQLSTVSSHAVYVNRMGLDGRFILPQPVVTSWNYADSIIRIGDTWFLAANGRTLTPFNPFTFVGGDLITLSTDYLSSVCPGFYGEALYAGTRDVPVASGWATQMFIRIVGSTVTHGRPAGK